MSRSTHYMGLSSQARDWLLQQNCHIKGNSLHDTLANTDPFIHDYATGLCHEQYPLLTYVHPTSAEYYEVVQNEAWSGGPYIFTHLVNKDGIARGSWTEEQMLAYL